MGFMPELRSVQSMEILGYLRPDGQIGIRNKVSIIYSTDCSRHIA
ncbi:MAG: UxaA family hydrolase, partial [Anaerolineae bacterium]|nr:UxaA family hydrolase [Anaerolineae bacterium]